MSAQRAGQAFPGGRGVCASSHVGGPKSTGTLRRAQKSFVPDAACPLVDRHKPLSKVSVPLQYKNVPVDFARYGGMTLEAISSLWQLIRYG